MSNYVDSNLMMGEQVTYWAQTHWVNHPKLVILSLGTLFTPYYPAGIIILGACFVSSCLTRIGNEFAVTNKRIIMKMGIISRRIVEVQLSKVESLNVDQSILGRIINSGTVQVKGSGGTAESFIGISMPLKFRMAVNRAAEEFRSGMTSNVDGTLRLSPALAS